MQSLVLSNFCSPTNSPFLRENWLIQNIKNDRNWGKPYCVGLNILDPLLVGLHIVTRHTHELSPALSELWSMRRYLAEFRSAHRREITCINTRPRSWANQNILTQKYQYQVKQTETYPDERRLRPSYHRCSHEAWFFPGCYLLPRLELCLRASNLAFSMQYWKTEVPLFPVALLMWEWEMSCVYYKGRESGAWRERGMCRGYEVRQLPAYYWKAQLFPSTCTPNPCLFPFFFFCFGPWSVIFFLFISEIDAAGSFVF